jgi:hypothetical protein
MPQCAVNLSLSSLIVIHVLRYAWQTISLTWVSTLGTFSSPKQHAKMYQKKQKKQGNRNSRFTGRNEEKEIPVIIIPKRCYKPVEWR